MHLTNTRQSPRSWLINKNFALMHGLKFTKTQERGKGWRGAARGYRSTPKTIPTEKEEEEDSFDFC
jgi:hypothetical protein